MDEEAEDGDGDGNLDEAPWEAHGVVESIGRPWAFEGIVEEDEAGTAGFFFEGCVE